jgi:hypothetical protein
MSSVFWFMVLQQTRDTIVRLDLLSLYFGKFRPALVLPWNQAAAEKESKKHLQRTLYALVSHYSKAKLHSCGMIYQPPFVLCLFMNYSPSRYTLFENTFQTDRSACQS